MPFIQENIMTLFTEFVRRNVRRGLVALASVTLLASCAHGPNSGHMADYAAPSATSATMGALLAPAPQTIEQIIQQRGSARLAELGRQIEAIFNRPDFDGARWGVYIRSYDTGEVIFSRNETQTFAPASNEKVFTTVGALLLLGPEFRYATQFYSTGELGADGRLDGDLIVLGNGNFWLGTERPRRDLDEQLAALAAQCRAAGITQIAGGLIGDDTWMAPGDHGWRGGSVVLDQNRFRVTLTTGTQELIITPPVTGITIYDEVERIPADSDQRSGLRLRRGGGDQGTTFTLTGRIRPGQGLSATGTLSGDRAVSLYLDALHAAFAKEGIAIGGPSRVIREKDPAYAALMEGATFRFQSLSPPMSELIAHVNKPSDNYRAERLFLTCGHDFTGQASLEAGEAAIKAVLLKMMGIRPEHYELADGSGLSRANQIRPIDLVTIFDAMRESTYFPAFYDSLPIAGVDGTIRNRMKGTPAEGNVRAKTGHIRGVTALSGYATSADGERLTFAMIINENQVASSVPDGAQNEVSALLAGFAR